MSFTLSERSPALNSTASKTPAPLCPIPRNGLAKSAGIILHLLLFLSSALTGIGICAMRTVSETEVTVAEICSGVIILLLVLHMWRVTRTAKAIVPLLIVVGGFLAVYTNSLIPAGVFCGVVFTVSEGSLLIAVQTKSDLRLLPLIPIAAYAVTAILSRDPVGAVAVLVPWPAAIVLAQGTRASAAKEDGPTRVGVICSTSVALGLSLGAIILLSIYRQVGSLDPAVLGQEMDAYREAIIQSFITAEIPEGTDPELVEKWKSFMTYANMKEVVNSAFNLLPGVAVACVLMLTAACQAIQHAALRTFGFEESVTDRVKEFRMSLISCVVFLIAYLMVMLDRSTLSSISGTVAQNLCIILLPGLALVGMLRTVRSLTKKGARGMGCLFFFIILVPCLLIVAPFIFAAVEVIGHIFDSVVTLLNPPEDDDDIFGGGSD